MAPNLAPGNRANIGRRDAKLGGEGFAGFASGGTSPDFNHSGGGELGGVDALTPRLRFGVRSRRVALSAGQSFGMGSRPVAVAARHALRMQPRRASIAAQNALGVETHTVAIPECGSPLGNHVSPIIVVRPRKQVCRICAGRSVAMVAREQAVGDCPVGEFTGHTMRLLHLAADLEEAVPVLVPRTGPVPTLGAVPEVSGMLVDLRPEALRDGGSSILTRHLLNLHYRFGGVAPRGVSAPPRLRCAFNYSTGTG
jgi:hypothetical protein